MQLEAELGGEADGTQNPHRVFPKPPLGIADDAQRAVLDVFQTVAIVEQDMLDGIVVERIGREVATKGVLVDGAVGVVAQDDALARHQRAMTVVVVRAAEGGDLDDLSTHAHMGDAEAAPDDAHAGEHRAHLFGRCVARDVEILRRASQQEVAHATANEVGVEAGTA